MSKGRLLPFLLSLFMIVVSFTILHSILIYKVINQQQTAMSDDIFKRFDYVYDLDVSILLSLAKDGFDGDCTQSTLSKMRDEQKKDAEIVELLYVKNNVIQCSTQHGTVSLHFNPLPEPTMTIKEGAEVWLSVPFRQNVLGYKLNRWTIIRYKNYVILSKSSAEKVTSRFRYPFELVMLSETGDLLAHIYGQHGVWQKTRSITVPDRLLNQSQISCSNLHPEYCVAIKTPLNKAIVLFFQQYLAVALLSLFSGWFVYYACRKK